MLHLLSLVTPSGFAPQDGDRQIPATPEGAVHMLGTELNIWVPVGVLRTILCDSAVALSPLQARGSQPALGFQCVTAPDFQGRLHE